MSDKKLIPQNRMEEYMDWLAGNKPAEGTLKPNNRSEAFMEEIAKRLDNGTGGGGGGSGFEPIDSPEAAKEFATEENLGKIAQYVGPDYDVEGDFDYVDRLAVSINEEVFKNKVKSVGPISFTMEDSEIAVKEYPGIYITEESAPNFGTDPSYHANYIFSSSDEKYAEYPSFYLALGKQQNMDMIMVVVSGTSEVTSLVQDLFNPDPDAIISVGGSSSGVMIYGYLSQDMSGDDQSISKGWHINNGTLNTPLTVESLRVGGDNWNTGVSIALGAVKGIGEVEGAGVYNFKFNGQWTPSIAEYGVSVSGAMDGDEVEVEYNGNGLFEVGKESAFYFDTSKNFDGIEDGVLLVATGVSGDEMQLKVSEHDFYAVQVEGGSEQPICVYSEASGWNPRYAIQIPVMTSIFPYTITTVNNQEQWKDIVSAAPLPNFSVKQKLKARLEAEIDAEKYITTVEGKGTETFTYDNGQWVTYTVSGGTSIDGTIIACEATIIYCNTIADVESVNALIGSVVPEGSSPVDLIEIASGGSTPQDYINVINQNSTYGGCFAMCTDLSEPGFVFNGSPQMASYIGFAGFIGESFNTQPRAEATLTIPSEYKDVVDQLFSLTPFEQVVVPADFNAKGITVKGTPVNGDKINIIYEDGELKAYELYRVDELTPSKYYEAGDTMEVLYFDTTKTPSNLQLFPFESNGGVILLGENGLYDEGLYWSAQDSMPLTIGTKILQGSGMMVDPDTIVYTATKGWIRNSIVLNKPIKLVESWTMSGTTINSDIEGAKAYVQKCPIGEEPESYYGLYKFYVSPDELSGGAAGAGVAVVDFGTIVMEEEGDISEEVTLSAEAIEILNNSDYCVGKFLLTDSAGEMSYGFYAPLDATMTDSYYGKRCLFSGVAEGLENLEIHIEAIPSMGAARIEVKEPKESGGTQLYKHDLTLYVVEDDQGTNPQTIHLDLTSWQESSFSGEHWRDLNGKYLGGFIRIDEWQTQLVSIINEQDNTALIYYDQFGNQQAFYPDPNQSGHLVANDNVSSL